jgi:hypothetical protein
MLGLLQDIFDIFKNIPDYILLAGEEAINGVISLAEAIAAAAVLVLPELPEVGTPPYLAEANWFFPIGAVISVAVPLVTAYGIWLGVKWIYKHIGDV